MEVSRRKGGEPESLDEISTGQCLCQPCREDGQSVEAYGYCTDCSDYLCKQCYESHRRVKFTKYHVLLNKAEMPRDVDTHAVIGNVHAAIDKLTTPCSTHPGKITEYHCLTHSATVCTACVMEAHESCLVAQIPDISKGIAASMECKVTEQSFVELIEKMNTTEQQVSSHIEDLDKTSAEYTRDVKTYRDKLVAAIDKLAADAEGKKRVYAERKKRQLTDTRQVIRDSLTSLKSMQGDMNASIKSLRENNLFILLKEAAVLIAQCKSSIPVVEERKANVKPFVFEEDKTILNMVKTYDTIGKLATNKKSIRVCNQINVRADNDNATCDITGLHLLLDGRLVVTDSNNYSIQLFDTNYKLTSHITLKSSPRDVADDSSGGVVVCMPKNDTIQFLSASDTLVPGRVVNTEVKCLSLAVCGDKLAAVVQLSREVTLLDMKGRRLKIVRECPYGIPRYLRQHQDRLYVSRPSGVTCITLDGEVMGEYSDRSMDYPLGIAVHKDGSVYVSGWRSNNVHHMTADCEKINVLGSGLVLEPRAICLNQDGNQLYVSEYRKDKLNVIQLEC